MVALSVREEALSGLSAREQDQLIDQLVVVKENLLLADEMADRVLASEPETKSYMNHD